MAPKVPKLNKDPRQKGIQGFLVKTPSASVPIAPPPASLLPTKSSLKRSKPGSNENDETNETSGLEQGKEKMMRINYEPPRTPLRSQSLNVAGTSKLDAIIVPDSSSPPQTRPSPMTGPASPSPPMSDERPVCGKPVILDGQPTDFDRFAELAGKFGDLRLADPNVFVGLDIARCHREAVKYAPKVDAVANVTHGLARSVEVRSQRTYVANVVKQLEEAVIDFRMFREGDMHPMKIAELSESGI